MTLTADGLPLVKAFANDLFPLDRLDPGDDVMAFLARILVTEYEEVLPDPGRPTSPTSRGTLKKVQPTSSPPRS